MAGKFGSKFCSYCGREFELVRKEQHLCCRDCHDAYFVEERRRALAAYREMKRYPLMIAGGNEADAKVA
jgi:DNA-directed RNA polymerase subunit RPC12/RpoP